MAHRIEIYLEAALFAAEVTPWLLREEARRCVEIGIIERLVKQTYVAASGEELEKPLLLVVRDGDFGSARVDESEEEKTPHPNPLPKYWARGKESAGGDDSRGDAIEAVGIQTLADRMIVAGGGEEAMRCLARDLVERGWSGSSIVGPVPGIRALAKDYAELSGRAATCGMQLRTFQLDAVCWPRGVAGEMVQATAGHRELLVEFIGGFSRDIGERESPASWAAMADRLIEGRRVFLWVDQKPVAMAAWAGPTPNGVRINFVYTPPQFRGRGYASNLVASLSQRMLNGGKKFCFLNTDLANPTSNSIYQKIGYRAVGESERWEFAS